MHFDDLRRGGKVLGKANKLPKISDLFVLFQAQDWAEGRAF